MFINDRELKTLCFKTDAQLGYIPETPVFFENKTVYENLKYVLKERNIPTAEINDKINKTLIKFKDEEINFSKFNYKHLSDYIQVTIEK